MKKTLMMVLSLVLVAVLSIGGTIAYLSSTAEVKNNIAVGSIAITMDESKVDENGQPDKSADRVLSNDYKIMPGGQYVKDPVIHVDEDSEECYVFVKVENPLKPIIKSNKGALGLTGYDTIENQMTAKVNVGVPVLGPFVPTWKLVDGTENIYQYYKTVEGGVDLQVFSGFYIDKDVNNLSDYAGAEITVTAYAIQAENVSAKTAAQEAVAALNA